MRETKKSIESGIDVEAALKAAQLGFESKGISVEYVKAMNASLTGDFISGIGRLLVAVVIEGVRLIDNIELSKS
jgi:pantothenate synthetase